MNLDELRTVQVDERGSDNLQPLPDSFYRDAADYIDDLRTKRKQTADGTDDPFDSDAVRRLTDEIETAEEVVEAIYERRVSKVVKRASLAAAGMPADQAGLTDEEAALFTELVAVIETNRETVLDVLSSDPSASVSLHSSEDDRQTDPAPTDEENDSSTLDSSTEPDSANQSPDSDQLDNHQSNDESPPTDNDRVTIRVNTDIGEIFGVDQRVYNLSAEDVVTLPIENAQPLIDRDAAERIK